MQANRHRTHQAQETILKHPEYASLRKTTARHSKQLNAAFYESERTRLDHYWEKVAFGTASKGGAAQSAAPPPPPQPAGRDADITAEMDRMSISPEDDHRGGNKETRPSGRAAQAGTSRPTGDGSGGRKEDQEEVPAADNGAARRRRIVDEKAQQADDGLLPQGKSADVVDSEEDELDEDAREDQS
ncbi:hypothetical protein HYPSUDRAFT_208820 [Hypholoma sublateritium FD-334 SS-4]|uniref:Uncharacterized protein n=1 Tax=Hypholoma sublateritium (strain FD-334 SS-4) TaxID=945553 RepID=A0A0D2N536_HYPSF|nr:hypothetical protein HYPSUDRAFT_208820 [Hypholoma sublateritium FD-334 SS-4]